MTHLILPIWIAYYLWQTTWHYRIKYICCLFQLYNVLRMIQICVSFHRWLQIFQEYFISFSANKIFIYSWLINLYMLYFLKIQLRSGRTKVISKLWFYPFNGCLLIVYTLHVFFLFCNTMMKKTYDPCPHVVDSTMVSETYKH